MTPILSLAVVGADYPNKKGPGRRFEITMCVPGEPIELVPEPRNPADERAIAVYSARGIQIGYVTAERAPWIGSIIRSGRIVTAIFQSNASYGAVIRAAFDGAHPILPDGKSEAEADTEREIFEELDWYPDETYDN